jgi:hydrogenase small subunit
MAAGRVEDVHIVWITAGLGCDGDTVSITAATQPSIEDVLLGAIPGLPRVHLHNPVLAFELGGDSFMTWWYQAERGELDPFVLVVEGSIPNEKIKNEGYWAALGTDPATGQPITTKHIRASFRQQATHTPSRMRAAATAS